MVLVEGGTDTSDEPEGTILDINPKAGTMVEEKKEIRVIVSRGKTKSKMPDLEGFELDYANNVLNALGLKINDNGISEQFNDKVPKGQIISQTPKKDTEISSNDKITVVVSKGSEIKLSTVPNLKGLDAEVAKTRLSDAKLTVVINLKETQTESESNKVLSQSIEGTKVEQGTPITLDVGKYVPKKDPVGTTVPGNTTPGTGTTPSTGTPPGTGTTPSTGTTPGTGTTTPNKTTTPSTGNKDTSTSPLDSTKNN